MEYTYNILNEVYYWMLSRDKNIEIRILKDKSEKIQVGDFITFYNIDNHDQFIKAKVVDKKIFDNIDEVLKVYDINKIMPNHTNDDVKKLIREIYGDELNTRKLVAFSFEFITSDKESL